MAKISYIEIAGKKYPMSFSLMASKKMVEKYGSASKIENMMGYGGEVSPKAIDAMADILELLISQGCAYKNYFEKDMPVEENSPVIDGKWTPLPREVLEIAIGIEDFEELANKITECISGGQKKEIKAKEIEEKGKNAEARQE